MPLSRLTRSVLSRYGVALAVVALAVMIRSLLHPFMNGHEPFLLLTLAVMTSAWYGGAGPGLLATGAGALAGAYFFMPPLASFAVAETWHRIGLALFVVVGVMISLLSGSLRSAKEKIEESARELKESEDRYRRVVEAANEGVWTIDHEARTTYVNARMAEMLGYEFEEMIGKSVFDLVFDEDREPLRQRFEDEKKHGLRSFDVRYRRKDGSELWTRFSATPTFDERDGSLVSLLGIFRDITERRRAEEERAQALAREHAARVEAEAANKEKDEFIAAVSHELRTPLASMLMWTRLLGRGDLDKAITAQAHQTLIANVKMLARLIDDLLDASRIAADKLRIEPQQTYLAPVVEAAIEVVRPAAEAKNINLTIESDASRAVLLADANRLQQVFWNLLSNAVKFTPEGGTIEVRIEQEDSHAQVCVADTGVGIPEDCLPRLFEQFYQVGGAERGRRGMGLGLAITRRIVEMHAGTIEAASRGEGFGSTFTVRLPLVEVESHTDEREEPPAMTEDDFSGCPIPLDGMRVLIVDDNDDARRTATMVLEACGASVEQAASCRETKRLMAEQTAPRWEVLVFDLAMPEEDGYELIRHVRLLGTQRGGALPALALTAYAGTQHRERALAAGFQAHLAKPVEPRELIRTIHRLAAGAAETVATTPNVKAATSGE